DHPLRVDRHRGGAQLMVHLDGLRVGAEAGRGDKDNEREGKQQGLVEQSVVTRPPGGRRRPVRHFESLASGWQVLGHPKSMSKVTRISGLVNLFFAFRMNLAAMA